jgi:hypothetical protein
MSSLWRQSVLRNWTLQRWIDLIHSWTEEKRSKEEIGRERDRERCSIMRSSKPWATTLPGAVEDPGAVPGCSHGEDPTLRRPQAAGELYPNLFLSDISISRTNQAEKRGPDEGRETGFIKSTPASVTAELAAEFLGGVCRNFQVKQNFAGGWVVV